VLPENVGKRDGLSGGCLRHFDELNARAKGSDWGTSPNVLQMILPPINKGRMPL
jgi:hypothetical protein